MAYAQANCIPETGLHLGRGVRGGGGKSMGENFMGGRVDVARFARGPEDDMSPLHGGCAKAKHHIL